MPLADDIDITVDDVRLIRVRIPNNWQTKASTAELEAALNEALAAALPAPTPPVAAASRPVRSDITLAELAECMELQQQWREALTGFQRRERAGEFTDDGPDEILDERERLSVTFADDRFEAIHFRPDWIEKATAQMVCDAILDTTADLDLVRPDRRGHALQHVHELDAKIRRFTS